ncbi:YbjQ family protein [Sulfuriflexus sp.]|uniref:YbjQ family protein n=1 Tax=Sulfuriflexus sp. TaxID=2015443 RepID=UPI0028CE838B|nr:YbjQ family protein [Sulfuriflexus sp.]MDT8404761.1 YbjQ family protein [Sulfuriflexus sp.]
MPYQVSLNGKTLILTKSDNGDLLKITDVRNSIEQKTRMLVIDKITIGDESGDSVDINSISDEELSHLLDTQEAHYLDVLKESISDAQVTNAISEWPISKVEEACRYILLTTESNPTGIDIKERIEIITTEVVYGVNIFRDIFASVRDFVGGRSNAMQKVLRDARKTCLAELKREALMVGADAIIAVKLDYSSIPGKNSNMLMLAASGTAVKIDQSANNAPKLTK